MSPTEKNARPRSGKLRHQSGPAGANERRHPSAAPAADVRRNHSAAPDLTWTFLSNHAHVLFCLSAGDSPPLREVAARVGVTERAVQKIVLDLEGGGFLTRRRDGRRNIYSLHLDRPLRHSLESHRTVHALMDFLRGDTHRHA